MTEGWRLLRYGLGVVPAITYHCYAVPVIGLYQTTHTFSNSHVAFFAINDLYARKEEMETASISLRMHVHLSDLSPFINLKCAE